MEDQEIIRLYWQRDEQAIVCSEQLYGAYCRRIAWNTLGLQEDVEECVNDTWHAAWNAIPPQVPACLRIFLGRITRNLAISRFRADRAKKRYSGVEMLLSELEDCLPAKDDVEQFIDRQFLAQQLNGWLTNLPEEDRVLFIRRYWHGDAVKSLAAEWDMTPAQMAQRMLRLRKSLRFILEGGTE